MDSLTFCAEWVTEHTGHNSVTILPGSKKVGYLGGKPLKFLAQHTKGLVITFAEAIYLVAILLHLSFIQLGGSVFRVKTVPIGNPHHLAKR